jgi:hypothetical protein
VSTLSADLADAKHALQQAHVRLSECTQQLTDANAQVQRLQSDLTISQENASLFKSEQERCLSLTAELHSQQARLTQIESSSAEEIKSLLSELTAEQKKTQLLKVCLHACYFCTYRYAETLTVIVSAELHEFTQS